MAKQNKRKKDSLRLYRMNAREAVNFFVGWLTTREKPIVLSRYRDAAPVAQLVGAFCDLNKLPRMRDKVGYDAPPDMEHVTNVVAENTQAAVAISGNEILQRMLHDIHKLPADEQNQVIARFLNRMLAEREASQKKLVATREVVMEDEARAYNYLREFQNILNGNFSVL